MDTGKMFLQCEKMNRQITDTVHKRQIMAHDLNKSIKTACFAFKYEAAAMNRYVAWFLINSIVIMIFQRCIHG
jgi:hypothetical protein